MTIGGIGGIGGIGSMGGLGSLGNIGAAGGATVGEAGQGAQNGANAFGQLLADLTQSSQQADGAITGLATGANADLHDVVLSTQFESLAFDLAVQIRNRLVDAYSEIFRMQV